MLSTKIFASICILLVAACIVSASRDDESYDNSADQKRMSRAEASKFLEKANNLYKRLFGGKDEEIREDNDELGERRAEAFEAYEEKCEPALHFGKRACAPIKECGKNFEANAFNNFDPVATPKANEKKPETGPKIKTRYFDDLFD